MIDTVDEALLCCMPQPAWHGE